MTFKTKVLGKGVKQNGKEGSLLLFISNLAKSSKKKKKRDNYDELSS